MFVIVGGGPSIFPICIEYLQVGIVIESLSLSGNKLLKLIYFNF